jgi:hypothetical protein
MIFFPSIICVGSDAKQSGPLDEYVVQVDHEFDRRIQKWKARVVNGYVAWGAAPTQSEIVTISLDGLNQVNAYKPNGQRLSVVALAEGATQGYHRIEASNHEFIVDNPSFSMWTVKLWNERTNAAHTGASKLFLELTPLPSKGELEHFR